MHNRSVSGHQLNGEKVVAGEPVLADQVADTAAKSEAADTGAGDQPTGCRQPVLLGGRVEVFQVVPPPANARRDSTSTCTSFSCPRSMTIPSSQVEKPATLCAPPRTAIGCPSLRAKPTVRATSSVEAARTIRAGLFVDRVIPYPTGRLVVRVPGADDRTGQADFQFAYRRLAEYAVS